MGRRKGEVTDRMRDKTHPFQVEMLVPETGLGNAHLIMLRLAARHDYETTHRRDGGRRMMRWCFCTREAADGFAADCGGRRVDLPVDPTYLRIDRPNARELARREKAARFGLEARPAEDSGDKCLRVESELAEDSRLRVEVGVVHKQKE